MKVSTLGEAQANAPTLESALTKSADKLTELRSSISANTAFFDKVKSACAMPDLDVAKIVAVESTTEETPQFTVYVDDRA